MTNEELQNIVTEIAQANPELDFDDLASMVYEAAEYYPTPVEVEFAVKKYIEDNS